MRRPSSCGSEDAKGAADIFLRGMRFDEERGTTLK
jgi:hypothetical protein